MFASRLLTILLLLGLLAAFALSAARPSSGAAGERRHVVRAGETLWALAEEAYGGDPRAGVWKIRTRNGLTGSTLVPGQVLLLPP